MGRVDCVMSATKTRSETYIQAVAEDGFAIVHSVVNYESVAEIIDQFQDIPPSASTRQRGQSYFGIRNLLELIPAIKDLATSATLRSLVDPIAGASAQPVRAIFFDKTHEANWKVAWHQDLSIAVRSRKDVPGFSNWTLKAGVIHVQPPAAILEQMLAVRIHLDATDEHNGALKVLPGSHKFGRLTADNAQQLRSEIEPVVCSVKKGDVMLMRPLLLHASSAANKPNHRRVIHLEYSSAILPGGLEWCSS
jgi:ectoine hydroxylase-related dioxygenase (phytanoyl-CoA dioxygenase family)